VDQEASAIARHIEEERSRLGATVDALEARARESLDWRRRFRDNAWAGLGAAFGVGLLVSTMFRRRSNGYVAIDELPLSRYRSGPNPALQAIQTAILGFLAHEARQFVERHKTGQTAYGGGEFRS
jgi:hypothetical protein